jgi:hypothetical protein
MSHQQIIAADTPIPIVYVAGSDIAGGTGTAVNLYDDGSTAYYGAPTLAFDGNAATYFQPNPTVNGPVGWLGKDFGPGNEKHIWSVEYTGQATQGVTDYGGTPSLRLYGSNTGLTDLTELLASDINFANSAGVVRLLTAGDAGAQNAYRYVFIGIDKIVSTNSLYCAKMVIKEAVPS